MAFAIEQSTEIATRYDFSILANARGYVDAVEVGVDLGIFAKDFLSRWTGRWLLLVDPYEKYTWMPYDRTLDMMTAANALTPYHGRHRFVRLRSPEAIPLVVSMIHPEFIYVDGSHEEADCYADLAAWWEILPPHGCLAGHDFDAEHPEVISAVEKFAREKDSVVRLTTEPDFPPSFYIYKQEPEFLMNRFFNLGRSPNPHHLS